MKRHPSYFALCASLVLSAVGAALGGGCAGDTTLDERPCPPAGTPLRYENFGKPFMARHCEECHGGGQGHSSRSFATLDSIRMDRERIFANSAEGNMAMPPGPDGPSLREREDLAEWLACGAP
jgi:Cytochrome C oxidase, cbb3-type, subunit III